MIKKIKFKIYFGILTIILLLLLLPIIDVKALDKNLVNIYFFHSEECSHCKEENIFLTKLEKKYNNIKVYRYEIQNKKNNEIMKEISELYQIKTSGVPLTIIGDTAYIGFSTEKSSKDFQKTIEYYSRYGYIDKAGDFLKITSQQTYKVLENNPTLKDFMKNYGNYQLIGNLHTDDLDIATNAVLLSIMAQFNLIKIFVIIILFAISIILKKKNINISYLFISYIMITYLSHTTQIIENNIYKFMPSIVLFGFIVYYLIKNPKQKLQKKVINVLLISTITYISIWLEVNFFSKSITIFKELLELYNITGMNIISYYGNFLFVGIVINLLYIIIFIVVHTKKETVK